MMEEHDAAQHLGPLYMGSPESRLTAIAVTLQQHLVNCEKRAARAEKLLWAVGALVVTVLGVLIKMVLHLPS